MSNANLATLEALETFLQNNGLVGSIQSLKDNRAAILERDPTQLKTEVDTFIADMKNFINNASDRSHLLNYLKRQ